MPYDGFNFTFDSRGRGGGGGGYMPTFDSTRDAMGVFLIGELERLDQTIHEPLVSVTWSRDIQLREDVTIADEVSSFTNSSFAAVGGIVPGGINWISKDANAIGSPALDIGKTPQPLHLWGMELSYTMPELESAMRVGRPIDDQKYAVIRLKHQMDTDQLVYIGDPIVGTFGLLNHPAVTNVTNINSGLAWATINTPGGATPDSISEDINELLRSVWEASGWAIMPTELRVTPEAFGILVNTKMSLASNISVLRYVQENSLCNAMNGTPLNIQPVKWLTARGVAGANRIMCYTNDYQRVRYPMTPLNRTPIEWRSIWNLTTYYGRLGVIEVVYPETLGYRDGV